MTSIWNQIVTAVYCDEWHLVELATECRDNPVDNAKKIAAIIIESLAERQIPEVVQWVINQPYIHKRTFAELIAREVKSTDLLDIVRQHCQL